jgi:hypothetical protein
MSRFHGPMGRGAKRRVREEKRAEAEARNALTLPERRRQFRCDAGLLRPSKKVRARIAEGARP